ncbi:hypothetical protein ACJDU8_19575 [Clostridium sp. WILCCON 0269]|uniref:Uncharacterized protein n=1 Tax=Candidatus Clostridium eludens TaxID=3381663 RepID=A0ABW8SNU4_9CLOT
MFTSRKAFILLIKIKMARLELRVYKLAILVFPSFANMYRNNLQNKLNKLNSEALDKLY